MWFVFFFKQKTAYEMRISDWSSDVCSSDLQYGNVPTAGNTGPNDLANVRAANMADPIGGINLSISVGSSKSSSKSTQSKTSAQGSQVMAGGDVKDRKSVE